MSDYYIEKIIDMVQDKHAHTTRKELVEQISKMLNDNWVAITGFGDD